MKRTFLKVSLFSLMAATMSVSFVGCKDYDDDIDDIHATTDAISEQVTALETALKQNQESAAAAKQAADQAIAAAEAAQKTGDQALAEAQAAAAQAELAKQAAATAKAEAIAEVIEQLKPLIDANSAAIAENANQIAALLGRIEGIEADLAKIDLNEVTSQVNENTTAIQQINSQLQAIDIQIAALEAFKTSVETQLQGIATDIDALESSVDAINTELTSLKGRVSTLETSVANNTASIATINSQISTINSELQALSTRITTEINSAMSTIAGTMSKRLTSVTLMPDLYIGGIPTIEFTSAKYTSKVLSNGEWIVRAPTSKQFIVCNNETEAQYRLNPATIGEDDIVKNRLAYVSRIATARSGEVENDLISVVSETTTVENGVLTVKLAKANTESLNLTDPNKIYTVSLKVPVAEKHLFTEQGETEFSVYSEYTRLNEEYFTPELRFTDIMKNPAVSDHLNDSTTMFGSGMDQMIAQSIVYSEPYDLNKLVQGCKFFSASRHEGMTIEQLKKYGFNIYYHKANHEYKVSSADQTDQQKFASIEGSILTPVLPSGVADNKTIIGKQPIIAATLYDDVNKQVIEQKYFKVKYAAEDMTPEEFDLPVHNSTLNCGDQVYSVTWGEMVKDVLSQYGDEGISKEDFAKIYTSATYVAKRKDTGDWAGSFTINTGQDGTGASTPITTWTIESDGLGKIEAGKTYTYEATVTLTNPAQLYPDVILNYTWEITVPAAPTLGSTDKTKWTNEMMYVYPVPMHDPATYDGTQTAEYETNILEGRNKPYVLNLNSPCEHWDLDFHVTTIYQGEIKYPSPYAHWYMTNLNQGALESISYSIPNDASGIALVQRTVNENGYYDIVLDWGADINGESGNRYVFAHSTLRLLQILKLNTVLTEELVDDSRDTQTIDLNKALTLTDAYKNLVAQSVPANPTDKEKYADKYYQYYVVQTPVFGTTVKLADDAEGKVNVRTLDGLNMTANVDVSTGTLTFQNNGAPLQADAYLIIPVTVSHKWGVLDSHVAVPVKHVL